MNKLIVPFMALCVVACEDQPQPTTMPTANQVATQISGQAQVSKVPAVIPRPADQAELDRLILLGYTPHADHLHAPGVNECPLSKGSDVVM
ncbi:MAG: hypothetical protein ABIW16_01320 [Sphingomicrobium sp.]